MSNTDTQYMIHPVTMHIVSNLVKPTTDVPIITLDRLMGILDSTPSYTEFKLEWIEGDRNWEVHLMARDIPKVGRRYTSLTHGTEWMDLAGILANHDGLVVRTVDGKPICQVVGG